jgi:hypothetical protein
MGLEAECRATWGRKSGVGKARLEEKELAFSGGFSLRIPLAEVRRVDASGGNLELEWAGGSARFGLGPSAGKWALKIRYPQGRLDKLGVKPGSRVAVIGVGDEAFLKELRERTPEVSVGRARRGSDLVFLALEKISGLVRLRPLRGTIQEAGAVWVLWPKGRKSLREDDVRAAARSAGLVDVKVVSFSETLSGLKLVVPVAQRGAGAPKMENQRLTIAGRQSKKSRLSSPGQDSGRGKTNRGGSQ